MAIKQQVTEISSQRDLEKEFTNISKIFVGKETESNWEERDISVKKIRSYLNSTNLEEHKEYIVRGIHDAMSGLIKSIHSLRTSVALEGLSLVSDISCIIGDALDQYTMETILSNLLKSSSVTKKLIVTKTAEVTAIFLTNTSFYTKMFVMLCKTINEKNVQLRQLSSTYIKTLLETHGSKEHVRSTIEKSDALALLDQFLKKGLVDAAPAIRDSCRSLYWTFHQLWVDQAEKLCKSLDTATQRQIEKSKSNSGSTTPKLTPRILNSRSNSMTSLSSLTSRNLSSSTTTNNNNRPPSTPPLSRTSSSSSINTTASSSNTKASSNNVFKKPALKRSLSAHSATGTKPVSRPIPATSSEVRRNINVQKMSRLSHISNVSAPSTNIKHKMNTISNTQTRRTQSEFHQQSVLASASLLHMLKSNDTHMKCKGIRLLSERLKRTPYNPSSLETILPPDVPTKIDLLPILMDTLSKTEQEGEIYQTLMSWESLAGIFVYVMSVNYYCPTLIIANGAANHTATATTEMMRIYSKGLLRVKMFLKRNDPYISQRLLNLLQSVMTDQKLLDSSIKRDLQLFPFYKLYLQCGLLNWMDEIVCDYIGIPEDEDQEMLMEGSAWLHVSTTTKEDSNIIAGQWFDINTNVQSYMEFILKALLQTKPSNEMHPTLCQLAGHLKMANQRVFDKEMKNLNKEDAMTIEKALGLMTVVEDGFSVENVSTSGVEDLCSELPPMVDSDMMEESNNCGLTQEISIIDIKPQVDDVPAPKIISDNMNVEPDQPIIIPPNNNSNTGDSPAVFKYPFARPSAPIPRRISLDVDIATPPRKRRKESPVEPISLDEQTSTILNFVTTKDEQMIPKIQELSMSMPTHQNHHLQFWSQTTQNSVLLFALIDTVSYCLIHSGDSIRSHAVILINKLLDNQKELFQFTDDSKYYNTLYHLTKALIITNVDVYDSISSTAEKAIENIFLRACSTEIALKTLWDLSKDDEFLHPKKNFSTHPLGTLFMYVSKIAPKASYVTLEKSLQSGAADTLVKGHGHTNVSVRKSCLQATLGIHKVLGDGYIPKYLSLLRTDQIKLLRLYLPKKNKYM